MTSALLTTSPEIPAGFPASVGLKGIGTTELRAQGSYTIHQPIVRKFKENRVIINGKDEQWQADLVDVQRISKSNGGYKHILSCINVLSNYAWIIPLKNETGVSLLNAFKQIFKDN